MNNKGTPKLIEKMTDFQPKKQTPEQVDEGLREAFKQAIKDGVMDATPYLKQMTFKSDIQKTEAEIKVLQKKLELLKEIETHKSLPKLDEETIMIDGVKYQKVEEPKPKILYEMFCKEHGQFINRDVICEIVERWLPDEDDGDDRYACGWNDCVEKLKLRLK